MAAQEDPEHFNCPYCGAHNSIESELCGVCLKHLRVPPEERALARARRVLAGAGEPKPAVAAALEAAGEKPAHRLWGRAALIAGLFIFYLQWLREEKHFALIDYVNLAFHEAGHVFFGFFGRFIMMLGGTITQLLIPALCLLQLRRKGANLGWQLCLFWLGQNLLNVSIYAADAIKQELPLVGGGEHDWTYLLTELGLIAHPAGVGRAIFLLGTAVIFYSFWLIGRDAQARAPYEFGDMRLY